MPFPLSGRPENSRAGQFSKMLGCVARKLRVMFENRRPSDALDVINCCRQPNRAGNVRCASLKSVRRFLERALFERDAYDHFTPAVPGRH